MSLAKMGIINSHYRRDAQQIGLMSDNSAPETAIFIASQIGMGMLPDEFENSSYHNSVDWIQKKKVRTAVLRAFQDDVSFKCSRMNYILERIEHDFPEIEISSLEYNSN